MINANERKATPAHEITRIRRVAERLTGEEFAGVPVTTPADISGYARVFAETLRDGERYLQALALCPELLDDAGSRLRFELCVQDVRDTGMTYEEARRVLDRAYGIQ